MAAAWMAQHQFGGAPLGERLGQLLAIGWSVTVSALALRTGMLPRWVGWTGLVASALYLTGQGDILATTVPGFPVWDLGGLLGSTLWGLWVLALGVAVLRSPAPRPRPALRATRRSRRRPERASRGFPTSVQRAVGWAHLRDVEDTEVRPL
jgi:Domain of unknown function (DUF4386)